jgi:hypothetical protein
VEAGTPEQRQKWATEMPLAWTLEFQPTILLPGKGQIQYTPWPFQQEFMNCRDRFRIINKPRQCGISTTVAAEVAWEFDNLPGAQIVIISKDKDAAVNFHNYVYNILLSVRKNNKKSPKLLKTNERVTTNSNGAKITSLASSKEAGRSFSATHLIFDELAFIEYADDIWQAANATLSQTNGKVTAISTPKGRANLFARIFEERDHMGFTIFQYAWWDVPTYNPHYEEYIAAESKAEKHKWIEKAKKGDWYRSERPKYTDLAWRQEFEGAFDANIGSVFSTRQLEKVFCKNYLAQKYDDEGVLTEWWTSEKDPNGIYMHGADLGRKNDPTVILTYDIKSKPARLVDFKYIEAGSCEWNQIQKIFRDSVDYWGSEGEHDGTGVGDSISDELAGYSEPFYFTKTLKENMITLMQHAFDYRTVRIPKIPILYREHQRYIWDDKHITQDTVMANGIAIRLFHDTADVFTGFAELNYVGAA